MYDTWPLKKIDSNLSLYAGYFTNLLNASKFISSTPTPLSDTSIKSSPLSFSFTSTNVAFASIAFSTNSFTAIPRFTTTYNQTFMNNETGKNQKVARGNAFTWPEQIL